VAAPIADKIILPLDTGNTGKKVRTQTRVIGADTVHEHFFIPISARSTLGIYWATVPYFTPPTTVQNGVTTGAWWLFVPIGSAMRTAVRRWSAMMNLVVAAIDLVAGEFRYSLFTFTGTASGAQITPGKRDSTDVAPVTNLRTASTGLTVTLVATIYEEMGAVIASATAVGPGLPAIVGNERNPGDEKTEITLRPGEGVVEWSALALTTANRRRTTNVAWEEYEI